MQIDQRGGPLVTDIIRRLFDRAKNRTKDAEKSQSTELDVDTQPLDRKSSQILASPEDSLIHLEPPQLLAGVGLSVGKQRDHNEDALFSLTTTMVSDTSQIPFGFYMVADGMGGHKHGEMASGIAVRAMAGHVINRLYIPLFGLPASVPDQSLQEIMQEGVQTAHQAIVKQTPGGGTTLTAVLILGDQLTVAHVGDSRAYILHPDGKIEVLTRDHSLVKRLEELGQLTPEEAAIHPQRNVLYRALGQGESFDAEIATTSLPRRGHLLVCSDGLWGVISENDLFEIVTSTLSPEIACQKLISAANAAGGPDNITAILVRLPD
jgi:serine/threonine protein phosphatase PrpC